MAKTRKKHSHTGRRKTEYSRFVLEEPFAVSKNDVDKAADGFLFVPLNGKDEAEPEQVEAETEKVEAEPEQVEAEPEQVDSEPKQVEAEPKQVEAETEPVGAEPDMAEDSADYYGDSDNKTDASAEDEGFYHEETDSDTDNISFSDDLIESKRKKKKKRKKIKLALFIVELVILLLAVAALFVVTKVEKVKKISIREDSIKENISSSVKKNAETGQMKGYTNIALFGVDTRVGELSKDTRSDTILIASINNENGNVKLLSVYRDTYLNLGNDNYNKCNSAYAYGGPEQAINMLNMNFDLNITDFVTVGFGGLVDAIDALGGLDLELTDAEIPYLNDYEKIMAKQQDMEYIPVTESGMQHLNGLQATAYCRIRYTSGDDFKRTERQRIVLDALFQKASKATPSQLTAIADDVFEEIYTSMDLSEILSYLVNIGNYSIESKEGIPQESMRATGTVGRKGSCVIPITLESNAVWLHHFLFEDYGYQPSSEVQEYSKIIEEDTGMGGSGTTTTTQTTVSDTSNVADSTTGIDPATGLPIAGTAASTGISTDAAQTGSSLNEAQQAALAQQEALQQQLALQQQQAAQAQQAQQAALASSQTGSSIDEAQQAALQQQLALQQQQAQQAALAQQASSQ